MKLENYIKMVIERLAPYTNSFDINLCLDYDGNVVKDSGLKISFRINFTTNEKTISDMDTELNKKPKLFDISKIQPKTELTI